MIFNGFDIATTGPEGKPSSLSGARLAPAISKLLKAQRMASHGWRHQQLPPTASYDMSSETRSKVIHIANETLELYFRNSLTTNVELVRKIPTCCHIHDTFMLACSIVGPSNSFYYLLLVLNMIYRSSSNLDAPNLSSNLPLWSILG